MKSHLWSLLCAVCAALVCGYSRSPLFGRIQKPHFPVVSKRTAPATPVPTALTFALASTTRPSHRSIPSSNRDSIPVKASKSGYLPYIKRVSEFFRTQLPMLKHLWPAENLKLRAYLVLSMMFMFTGKWFNTRVPFMLQRAIDSMTASVGVGSGTVAKGTIGPVITAILLYGVSRALAVFCEELKTCLFTCVSQDVLRKFAHQIFSHLHTLGSDFHLQTPSGVISVAYVRAVRGFQALMFQLVFSVAPTALELAMVARILQKKFSPTFAAVTLATFSSYMLFTIFVTQWRVRLRREIVEVDNARNGFFIDSLLNQEVVKLFNNEQKEINRFDSYLDRMKQLNINSTYAIAALNIGQAILFCAGLTASLLVALQQVRKGKMTVGDVVAVNAMLLQLAVPFDFIGYTYQELRQALVDMAYMTEVLNRFQPSVPDTPLALPLETYLQAAAEQQQMGMNLHASDSSSNANSETLSGRKYMYFTSSMQSYKSDPTRMQNQKIFGTTMIETQDETVEDKSSDYTHHGPSTLEFKNVVFSYKKQLPPEEQYISLNRAEKSRVLLANVSFKINAGEDVAIVGPSGSGKSTVLKLITRMLDAESGEILLDGVNIGDVTKASVRRRVAVVPQDTCLFDETVGYNIRYGSANATDEEVREVVKLSSLQETIEKLPQGLDTVVGERGGRLSGGERQKVSIARALLRNPSLLLCDEVTSSVDAIAEREIIDALRRGNSRPVKVGTGTRFIDGKGNPVSLLGEAPGELKREPVRTSITVAHRLSSIAHCDRILVLKQGRVVEQGTHHELLLIPNGVYRSMWEVQNSVSTSLETEGPDHMPNVGNYSQVHPFTNV